MEASREGREADSPYRQRFSRSGSHCWYKSSSSERLTRTCFSPMCSAKRPPLCAAAQHNIQAAGGRGACCGEHERCIVALSGSRRMHGCMLPGVVHSHLLSVPAAGPGTCSGSRHRSVARRGHGVSHSICRWRRRRCDSLGRAVHTGGAWDAGPSTPSVSACPPTRTALTWSAVRGWSIPRDSQGEAAAAGLLRDLESSACPTPPRSNPQRLQQNWKVPFSLDPSA